MPAAARRKRILLYFAAVTAPIVALLLRLALERHYGRLPPYVLLYPVVLLAAMLGGLWAGLLATTTSALLSMYWVLPPTKQFGIERPADALGFVIFCVMGIGISAAAELHHRLRWKLAAYEKEQTLQIVRRTADARYHKLFDSIDEGFCTLQMLFDQNGTPNNWRFLEVNPAFERQTGFEHAKGKTIRELVANVEPRWLNIYAKVALTGEAVRFVEFSKALNRWFDFYAFRIGEPDEHRVAVLLKNITERKKAAEALQDSEERLSALVTASSDVIYRMSPDWSEMRVLRSPTFLAETETPSGNWFQKYIHPDDQPHVLAVINEAIRTKSTFELEHRVLRADGSLGWAFSRAVPLLDANGEILEWFGAASDITERKRAEEALQRSEERLRLAQQIAQVGAFDWEIRTGIQNWTPELEALYGLSPGNFAGTQTAWENLLHAEDRSEALKRVESSLQTGAITEGEWRVTWPDGSVHWLAGRWQVSKDPLGNPAHMTGFNIDITQRKLAEQALIRSEKLASVGRMAATIAHEVNNPLSAAINAVYLVNSDPGLSCDSRKHLAMADDELRRAAHITQQALGFYRENGKRTPVALPKLIDEVLSVYARKLQERRVTVATRYNCGPCREGCESCFIVNSGEMRQIISNLVGNGVDALRDGGRMYIRVSRLTNRDGSGQDIHLTIADNGCGIRSENLKRIFEPFFTTKESVGTGLGLWVAQELVRNHNGSIKVRSSKDSGTVFRVSIPAAPLSGGSTATKSKRIVTRITPAQD